MKLFTKSTINKIKSLKGNWNGTMELMSSTKNKLNSKKVGFLCQCQTYTRTSNNFRIYGENVMDIALLKNCQKKKKIQISPKAQIKCLIVIFKIVFQRQILKLLYFFLKNVQFQIVSLLVVTLVFN